MVQTGNFQFNLPNWNTQLHAQPQFAELHYQEPTGGMTEIDGFYRRINFNLGTRYKNFELRAVLDSWPGLFLSWHNSWARLEIGQEQEFSFGIKTHTSAQESRSIQFAPVDSKIKAQIGNDQTFFRYQIIQSLYDPSYDKYHWEREMWLHHLDGQFSTHWGELRGDFRIARLDYQGVYDKIHWLRIDAFKWMSGSLAYGYSGALGHINAGLTSLRCKLGPDTYLDPIALSPLSSLQMKMWRLMGTDFTFSGSWVNYRYTFQKGNWTLEPSFNSLVPLAMNLQGSLKSKYITTMPFFSYKTDSFPSEPTKVIALIQPQIELAYNFGNTALHIGASQIIPIQHDSKFIQSNRSTGQWGGTRIWLGLGY